ncbi:hypothetical protein D9M71_739650 [compost metagenome]
MIHHRDVDLAVRAPHFARHQQLVAALEGLQALPGALTDRAGLGQLALHGPHRLDFRRQPVGDESLEAFTDGEEFVVSGHGDSSIG